MPPTPRPPRRSGYLGNMAAAVQKAAIHTPLLIDEFVAVLRTPLHTLPVDLESGGYAFGWSSIMPLAAIGVGDVVRVTVKEQKYRQKTYFLHKVDDQNMEVDQALTFLDKRPYYRLDPIVQHGPTKAQLKVMVKEANSITKPKESVIEEGPGFVTVGGCMIPTRDHVIVNPDAQGHYHLPGTNRVNGYQPQCNACGKTENRGHGCTQCENCDQYFCFDHSIGPFCCACNRIWFDYLAATDAWREKEWVWIQAQGTWVKQ